MDEKPEVQELDAQSTTELGQMVVFGAGLFVGGLLCSILPFWLVAIAGILTAFAAYIIYKV